MALEPLYGFQQEIVDWATDGRTGAALFPQQGCGKTYITAGIIQKLMRPGFVGLVVVPLANVETTWVRTLKKLGVAVHRSWDTFREAAKLGDRPKVLLLHYEALGGGSKARKIVKRHWDLVVYDESQRLKARGSRASRTASRFDDVGLRVILSGTPIEQCSQDLWAQFRFALPDVLGKSWEGFCEDWMYKTGYMGLKLKFRPERLPKFLELIGPHIRRVTKKGVLDLPPMKYIRSTVQMLGTQARVYREVTQHQIAHVDGGTVTCDMEITRLIRQQQVVGGFVQLDPTEEQLQAALNESLTTGRQMRRVRGRAAYFGSAKARRLRRILRRLEREKALPVVVFCKYKEELRTIVNACAHLRVGVISGKTKKKRTATVDAFQRGEFDVLVCQIRAGGVGLDLFRASEAIFYSCTFSSIDFEQAVCRVHRNGQTRPCRFWLIQAANTVDTEIWTGLLLKKSVTRLILDKRK